MYSEIVPNTRNLVIVEWLDITGGDLGLSRRWTVGHLLSTTFVSEGVECTVLGGTWDEDEWADYSTFPNSVVVSIERQKDELEGTSPEGTG